MCHIQSLGGTCIISKILVIQATVHRINKCVFTLFHRIILIQILYGLLLLERFLTLCQTLHENSWKYNLFSIIFHIQEIKRCFEQSEIFLLPPFFTYLTLIYQIQSRGLNRILKLYSGFILCRTVVVWFLGTRVSWMTVLLVLCYFPKVYYV